MAGLILGGITFAGFEIPNQINFGGSHTLATHELIGGQRVFDAMGAKPDQITWSGRFRGPDALARAQAVDEMRMAGAQVDLAWLNLFRSVVITAFKANTERSTEVTYSITCEVVNETAAGGFSLSQGIDGMIGGDVMAARNFTASPAATSAVGAMAAAFDAIGPIDGAPRATRLAAARATSACSVALQAAFAQEDASLGVAMPKGHASDMAAWLIASTNNAVVHSATADALAYVVRIGANIATVKI